MLSLITSVVWGAKTAIATAIEGFDTFCLLLFWKGSLVGYSMAGLMRSDMRACDIHTL